MHLPLRQTSLIVAGITLGGLLACQASRPPANPGALPSSRTDMTPRLNASTYVAHGHLLEQQGECEQAANQYRLALQIAPDLLMARNRLGITLNKLGRHGEASAAFRAALERNPAAAFLHNNLGFSLYLEGRYEEAERALARAVQLQPLFRRAQMNHGLALAKLGRYDEALAAFGLAGSQADAYYNLAVLQTEAGRYADAARALQNALSLDPEFEDARVQLREVARLTAAEELDRAAQAAALTAVDRPVPEVAVASDVQDLPDGTGGALGLSALPMGSTGGDVNEGLRAFHELAGAVSRTVGMPSLSAVAGVVRDLRATVAEKARWWEDAARHLARSLGLRDKPY